MGGLLKKFLVNSKKKDFSEIKNEEQKNPDEDPKRPSSPAPFLIEDIPDTIAEPIKKIISQFKKKDFSEIKNEEQKNPDEDPKRPSSPAPFLIEDIPGPIAEP